MTAPVTSTLPDWTSHRVNMTCLGCRDGAGFTQPFSMAFQPILDLRTGSVFAHEALVRGTGGEGAWSILGQLTDETRYAFDQQSRVKAIEMATALGLVASGAGLSINFTPNAVYEPTACIRRTLSAADRCGFPLDRIIFEFTENEDLDVPHVLSILETYKSFGFRTAIDDFGAGQAGLSRLVQFQPDIVKLDMELIRGIDADPVRRSVVKHMLRLLDDLGIQPVCEGVETADELAVLVDLGVDLVQGFHIAHPAFEALVEPSVG
ncbi:EAL domain-containing protein [Amorphus orientalis]|uniref:EAL domain-containing protein (Putative c-di-GMP-specific phosphodiesterase class I) n=1 Tax=Amorphus orientalis TaxID=649198 RepID=A0AAE4ASH3_9HYPH|nr:EAL domain-containing protein [Amorphus orientalis]MDQ0315117.1 EAL domain-containing protein (putative c-di-GMP-specific phosphodiesterase class I) [Amorphus orientalis]